MHILLRLDAQVGDLGTCYPQYLTALFLKWYLYKKQLPRALIKRAECYNDLNYYTEAKRYTLFHKGELYMLLCVLVCLVHLAFIL